MAFGTLSLFIFSLAIALVNGNIEGDVLYSWKKTLDDPNGVLGSWDPTLINPCTWFHLTCNNKNRVTRIDLGNAGLSGTITPLLGRLTSLQHLNLYGNDLRGVIPSEIGKLTHLQELKLYSNQLSGSIPATLGNLTSLKSMRLNSNKLRSDLPIKVLRLVQRANLKILNVSDNLPTMRHGSVPTKSKGLAITTIIQDRR